jgi:hypothetical protein
MNDLIKSGAGREMYYNISNTSEYQEYQEYQSMHLTRDEMRTDLVRDTAASPPPLAPLSEKSVEPRESGSDIADPAQITWICAQWAWSQTRRKKEDTPATRLRITVTLQYQGDTKPKKITFNLTDRLREFQDANVFQKHIKTTAALNNHRWLGKARIRQPKNYEGALPEHYRKNIPDMAMSAWLEHSTIHARLWTTEQQIDLVFDQPLTAAQSKLYEGEARWGTKLRNRVQDDFYDWRNYA